jgi:Cys/Met metabolism PLP-dependent enzyme
MASSPDRGDGAPEHLIMDNTACPILCQPIKHGAAITMHSTTKYIGGHGAGDRCPHPPPSQGAEQQHGVAAGEPLGDLAVHVPGLGAAGAVDEHPAACFCFGPFQLRRATEIPDTS